MTDRELMQMALDALENAHANEPIWKTPIKEASEALRSRLANEFNPDWNQVEALQESLREHMAEIQRLRARLAQPEQIISQEWQPANPDAKLRHYSLVLRDLDKTIEGWCEQPEFYLDGKRIDVERLQQWSLVMKDGQKVPMDLTHREWQGLTDEEIQDMWSDHCRNWQRLGKVLISPTVFGQAIEAKLKEKNSV